MARLFNGNSGTSSYNAAEGKFNEVNSVNDPTTGLDCVPFNYGTEADFVKKVDLSLAGQLMDCAECHVGGGAMEYIPNTDLSVRIRLDEMATTNVPGFGGTAAGAPVTSGDYTAFNYFIDTYDVDGDGDKTEAQYINYTDSGVMEMDCLMCHLPGYDYEGRRDLLRKGKLGALMSVGSGLASENGAAFGDPNFGTTVVYDASNPAFEVLADDQLGLTQTWAIENLTGRPDSNNCATCHMNEFSVDWKKRGDNWAPEGQYDFAYEVHYNIGCMGCHERDTDSPPSWVGPGGSGTANYPSMAPGSLGHDPAKGIMAQYSGLYNKNDGAQFKDCVDCHTNGTDGQSYAAPNPEAAHAAYGLTAKVAQGADSDGVADKSHMDFMHCSACHSRKIDSYAWGNTGSPMIDATGADHDGRLTDHENVYVTKPDMTDQTSLQWYKGMLRRVTPSATMFYRDKNDTPALDANFDGRPHGMDALLMTDVLAVNELNGWDAITYDTLGNVTQADFTERLGALATYIENKAAVAPGTAKIKFSIFHVNFMNQHAVSPAAYAWGSGAGNDPLDPADDNADTCTDCHSAASNFYNGFVDTTGPTTMNFGPSTSQRVPFTKVNGFSQPTDWHPNQFDKSGARSIAIQISNVDNGAGGLTTRDVQISENMYENTFMTVADFAPSYTSSSAIDFSGFEKGWQLIVQVNDGTERLKMVSTNIANVGELLTNLGTNMTDGTFGFTITADGAGTGITVTGINGNLVRLKAGNAASFKLTHAAYKNVDWIGVDGNPYGTRAAWTAYLDSIDSSNLPVPGVATIATADPASVEVNTAITLAADETVNAGAGEVDYSWICNNSDTVYPGSSVDITFDSVGTYTCNLRVEDALGNLAQDSISVQVTAPAPLADIALVTPVQPAGSENSVSFSNLPAHTMLYIIWGDGLKQRVYDTATSVDVAHTFRMYSKYFDGTNYNYRTTVYVYNGSSRVDVKRETLSIAP